MDTETDLLAHILLPVAHDEDARLTARTLEPYGPDRVTALHVVETGGAPDAKQTEGVATAAFDAVHLVFPDADTRTAHSDDVLEAIFESAADIGASAIAYRSRGGGRLLHFLSGDLSLKLATQSPIPVVALPTTDELKAATDDERED